MNDLKSKIVSVLREHDEIKNIGLIADELVEALSVPSASSNPLPNGHVLIECGSNDLFLTGTKEGIFYDEDGNVWDGKYPNY